MATSRNNLEAAAFMNVHWTTWKKYASRYMDEESGVTLYKKHTPQWQKKHNWKQYWYDNIRKPWTGNEPVELVDVFRNKATIKNKAHLISRMITEEIKKKECEICGYNHGPIYDYKRLDSYKSYKALRSYRLIHLNGNEEDSSLENLLLVCLNCYSNIFVDKKSYKEMITHEDGTPMELTEIALMILHRTTIRTVYDNPSSLDRTFENLKPDQKEGWEEL